MLWRQAQRWWLGHGDVDDTKLRPRLLEMPQQHTSSCDQVFRCTHACLGPNGCLSHLAGHRLDVLASHTGALGEPICTHRRSQPLLDASCNRRFSRTGRAGDACTTESAALGESWCAGPLQGMRVLDLSRILAGPVSTMVRPRQHTTCSCSADAWHNRLLLI